MILAPHGMRGTLTGQTFKMDAQTLRELDDWRYFFHINFDFNSSNCLDPFVEVVYSSKYLKMNVYL